MRLIKWTFWFLILSVLGLFMANNMQNVEIRLVPVGVDIAALAPIQAPLALPIFVSLGIGLLLGIFLEHLRAGRVRKQLRQTKREARALKTDADRMQAAMKEADHPDSVALPAPR